MNSKDETVNQHSKTTLNFYQNNKPISKWDKIQTEYGRRQNEAAREDRETRTKKCQDQNQYNMGMSKHNENQKVKFWNSI